MARHKVYGSMQPWFGNTSGRAVNISSRRKITQFDIDLNADCDGQQNLEGVITVKYDDTKDRTLVIIDCPDYDVVIKHSKHTYKYNTNKHGGSYGT